MKLDQQKSIINRFQWALERKSIGQDARFDRDLYGFDEVCISPSVGSIVPGWLLAIPRSVSRSVSDLDEIARDRFLNVVKTVARDLNMAFDGQPWIFEHGSVTCGSVVGCGTDQAHLHMVPLEFDLFEATWRAQPTARWIETDLIDPWSSIEPGREYHLIGDFSRAFFSYVEYPTSQFFRRVIADVVGRSSEWDYRITSHERNAGETIRKLVNPRSAA